MQLPWMILFSLCLLFTCCRASAPVDDSANPAEEENVERRRSLLRSGGRRRQQDGGRMVGGEDEIFSDDQSPEVRINSNDGDQPRRSSIKSDNVGDVKDADKTSRGRIRILNAGFRRMGDSNLRPLHDPTLTDDDLNRFDDNNIENELNALAAGFRQNNDVEVDDVEEGNYEGLGFGDTELSLHNRRLDTNDFTSDENIHIGPPWTEWRHCNVTCGVGQQSRWRLCRDDKDGVCNRVTGRLVEWRRCLGMECDQKTIEELGGGCKDQLMMSLLIGVLIGSVGSVLMSAGASCLYAWCKKPIDWKLSDFCPESCDCGRCTECCQGCCDPNTCAGCGGPCPCCWCLPCCDPYAQRDRMYYHKQMRMNNAYQLQHNLGPGTPGSGGRRPYKRPPAALPRESVKRKPYYDEPQYAEIDQVYQGSPRKKQRDKQKQKQNYVKFTRKPTQQYHDSFDEEDGRKQRAPEQVENDYLDILGEDDDVENAYLTPTLRGERYESDFEYLDAPPVRPR